MLATVIWFAILALIAYYAGHTDGSEKLEQSAAEASRIFNEQASIIDECQKLVLRCLASEERRGI